jgi:hypothetical protein
MESNGEVEEAHGRTLGPCRIPVSFADMIGRNDPCPCGSGKKYKKCCLDQDAIRMAETDDPEVEGYRPAALPTAGGHLPAIACMRENPEQCLFVLVRTSRPLASYDAIAEADLDIGSSPGSSEDGVGPDCLRYLDKIGYRKTPGVQYEILMFSPEYGEDQSLEGVVCAECGERHRPDFHPDDEELEDDEEDGIGEGLEADLKETLLLFKRIVATPPTLLQNPEITVALADLIDDGFDPEIAIARVLQVAADEAERMKADGETEPNLDRFATALRALYQAPDTTPRWGTDI